MIKIITSGCSYSEIATNSNNNEVTAHDTYPMLLGNKANIESENMGLCGQSNYSIIKRIYDRINKKNTDNSLFICQLTFLHRKGNYVDVANHWVDFQPTWASQQPKLDKNKQLLKWEPIKNEVFHGINLNDGDTHTFDDIDSDIRSKILNSYENYLKYEFNEDAEFKYLMYQIDMLQSYVEKNNSKVLFIYWPMVNNQFQLSELKSRNFFNLDGEYSILTWSTKNNLLGFDSHLNPHGHDILSNKILEFIN